MSVAIYVLAAVAEISGCFAFWAWWRLEKSMLWTLPGTAALILFAWLLAQSPSDFAGRSYAVYGGIYIVSSLVWLWLVEGQRPDLWDVSGSVLCLAGAMLIFWGPRGS